MLYPTLLPYLDGHSHVQQERPHIARQTIKIIREVGANVMPWLSRLLDVNLIKLVKDMKGRKLSSLQHSAQTLAQVIHKVQIAFNEMPQEDMNQLIMLMPRRLQECIQLRKHQTRH